MPPTAHDNTIVNGKEESIDYDNTKQNCIFFDKKTSES